MGMLLGANVLCFWGGSYFGEQEGDFRLVLDTLSARMKAPEMASDGRSCNI